MALIPSSFVIDNRNFQEGLVKAKVLTHTFDFPYLGDIQNLITAGFCTIGNPPGLEFVSSTLLDLPLDEYDFNLFIPEQYETVVRFQLSNTPELEVGDILVTDDLIYEVQALIPQGSIIPFSDLLDITETVLRIPREITVIQVPGLGIYDVSSGNFCPFAESGEILPANLEFLYDAEPIYKDLPLNTYNLGELEDRNIVVLQNRVELGQVSFYLATGQNVYLRQTQEYYTIIDDKGTFIINDTGLNQISPTRYLMKGADASLDLIDQRSLQVYDDYINPSTAKIENLPWTSQIFGVDLLADGVILDDNFLGLTEDRNPFCLSEIRTLLLNAQGWCRPDSPLFEGIVKLNNDVLVNRVDFIFDGSNNFFIFEGDKGIHFDGNDDEWTAIEPTTDSIITLENSLTTQEITVDPGTRLYGVLFDRESILSAKGEAMSTFVDSIPLEADLEVSNFLVDTSDYAQGVQTFEYLDWISDPLSVELVPGHYYTLSDPSSTIDFSNVEDLNTGFISESAFGNIEVDDDSIIFQVNPNIDPYVRTSYMWEDFITLEFQASKLKSIERTEKFDPANWKGIVGSKGSLFGMTVANTIIGLQNKVPTMANDKIAVTRTTNSQEFTKAKKLEEYIGSANILTHVQNEDLVSDVSFSEDYWFTELDTPRETPYTSEEQFLRYGVDENLITLRKSDWQIKINGNLTNKFLPENSVLMTDGEKLFYYDPFTRQIYRAKRNDILSPFVLFEQRVLMVNASHGFYLVEEDGLNNPATLKRNGKVIEYFPNGILTDYFLIEDYPWLRDRIPATDSYTYTDLLNPGRVLTSEEILTNSTSDSNILYTQFLLAFVEGKRGAINPVAITENEQISKILPEYFNEPYYSLQSGDFGFYQVEIEELNRGTVAATRLNWIDKNSSRLSESEEIDFLTQITASGRVRRRQLTYYY